MKISTKGRYGLKAMVDIAVFSADDNCVSLKSISERQGISENYLEQLIALLKKADFVKSIRGSLGGYILNVNPDRVTVLDIINALEGPMAVVDCVSDSQTKSCGFGTCNKCVTKNVWEKVNDSVLDTMSSITLGQLVDDYKKVM